MIEVEEVLNFGQTQRVTWHNHVTGLGLDKKTGETSSYLSCGLIGQEDARQAAGIVIEMIKYKHLAGRGVLFVGPSGSGKTAIVLAIARELGNKVPFFQMSGSDIYSCEIKKTSVLMENFRRAIGVRMKEIKEIYEGELIEVTETYENESDGDSVIQAVVKLKSAKGTKLVTCNEQTYQSLKRENVNVGDIVYIEVNGAFVKRVGKCDIYATDFDLEAEEYVPLPKGDVFKKREVTHDITLHDIDEAYARSDGADDVVSMFRRIIKTGKTEMTDKLRQDVNETINKYVEQGMAEIIPGILFIDEVHMFDLEALTYLHKALESGYSPTIILATNRTETAIGHIEGEYGPHGLPYDLLNRLLIVRTSPYDRNQLKSILRLRMKAEDVNLNEDALDLLSGMAKKISLRYAIQLLTPSLILAKTSGKQVVTTEHVSTARKLFKDGNYWMNILASSDHFYG